MNILIWRKSISRITVVIYLYINNISLFIVSPFCTCINFGKRGVGTFSCLMMIDFCCYNSLKSNFEVMCANIKRRLHTIFFIETFFHWDFFSLRLFIEPFFNWDFSLRLFFHWNFSLRHFQITSLRLGGEFRRSICRRPVRNCRPATQ